MLPTAICASCQARIVCGPASRVIFRISRATVRTGFANRGAWTAGRANAIFSFSCRPVAGIVAEEWATEQARDQDGEAEQIMNFLGVGPGMTVADLASVHP